ncbi:MAG TPA: hypothetical protein VK900_14775 [Anaerolineales bacterium]|nr:hypothetical protein [Anaerolineales bacterium]
MAKKKKQHTEPPQPPSIERKFKLYPTQLIGIPLMILVPLLALLGIFGKTHHAVTASSPQLEMRVEYPTRFRYKMIDAVTVSLTNISAQPITALEASFDRTYIEGFSTVIFTPAIEQITETAYLIEVTDLQPGETRVVSVAIQAERYGMHQGAITVTPGAGEALYVMIETFTFP